jgi:hypothetical protein
MKTTIINATNLLGDSLYTLQPIKQYLDTHTEEEIKLVADRGLAFQMFQDTFQDDTDDDVEIFDNIDSAIRSCEKGADLSVFSLNAGASGHICFTRAQQTGRQPHISEGFAEMLGMQLKEPPLPYAPWNTWEPDLQVPPVRIGISPFSRSCSRHSGEPPNKTLDDWKWMHIINYLRPHLDYLQVLGGPNDRLTGVSVSEDEYWCASSFEDLRKKLKSLTLFITVDNGLGHIASALNVPTVLLWPRVSSMEFIGPIWAPNTKYITPIDPPTITPANILNGLRHFVKERINAGDASSQIPGS